MTIIDAQALADAVEAESHRAALTDAHRLAAAAGIAQARQQLEHARCPGTGQIVRAGSTVARCAHCQAQVATVLRPGDTLPTLLEHTAPVRPRQVCFLEGCDRLTPSASHRWCSAAHHRLDEPDEYDDRTYDEPGER